MPRTTNVVARKFLFTWNNPEGHIDWDVARAAGVRGLCYQAESGENGTYHFQGYLETVRPMRCNAVSEIIADGLAHVEKAWDPEAAHAYSQKDDTRLEGPWTFGTFSSQGKRTDLNALIEGVRAGRSWVDLLADNAHTLARFDRFFDRLRREIVPHRTEAPRVIIITGPTGTGKSHYARTLHPLGEEAVFRKNPDSRYWFDYKGQPIVSIDEFTGQIPYTTLLQLCDKYPTSVPTFNFMEKFVSSTIVITSNVEFENWFPLQDLSALRRRVTSFLRFDQPYNAALSSSSVVPPPPPLRRTDGDSIPPTPHVSPSHSAGAVGAQWSPSL